MEKPYKTKKDRREVYYTALDMLLTEMKPDNVYMGGMCALLYVCSGKKAMIMAFPEVMKHAPTPDIHIFWYLIDEDGTSQRIAVLMNAIMDTL